MSLTDFDSIGHQQTSESICKWIKPYVVNSRFKHRFRWVIRCQINTNSSVHFHQSGNQSNNKCSNTTIHYTKLVLTRNRNERASDQFPTWITQGSAIIVSLSRDYCVIIARISTTKWGNWKEKIFFYLILSSSFSSFSPLFFFLLWFDWVVALVRTVDWLLRFTFMRDALESSSWLPEQTIHRVVFSPSTKRRGRFGPPHSRLSSAKKKKRKKRRKDRHWKTIQETKQIRKGKPKEKVWFGTLGRGKNDNH